jgi:hypothetical protein
MNETVKLIIEIDKDLFERIHQSSSVPDMQGTDIVNAINVIKNGTPLDDVKAEIEKLNPVDYGSMFSYESHNGARDMQGDILDILDNIGKGDSE